MVRRRHGETHWTLPLSTQLTTFRDTWAKDVTPPHRPSINSVVVDGRAGYVRVDFNRVNDRGTEYSFYVEATGLNDDMTVRSPIVVSEIKTGVRGYNIIFSDTPLNLFTFQDILTTENYYVFNKIKTNSFYVNLVAIDNAGNISEIGVFHYNDVISPTLNINKSEEWTNDYVDILVSAIDNESGVRGIILPNGNFINKDETHFRVTENGIYQFIAEDFFGNQTTAFVTVSNIDKTPPTFPKIMSYTNWTNKNVEVKIEKGIDLESGVDYVLYRINNGPWRVYTNSFMVKNEGIATIEAKTIDKVGNVSEITQVAVKIDRTSPSGKIRIRKRQ